MSYKFNCFIAVACLMLTANSASARPWYVTPGLLMTAGYDDNPALNSFFDSGEPDTGRILSGSSPFATFGGDIRLGSESESDLIAFDLAATARRFSDAQELDSEFFLASALYEKNGINNDYGIVTGYTSDSRLETQLIDTGIISEDYNRNEFYFRPTLTTRFSPLWVGDFALGYSDVKYDQGPEDEGIGTDFVDFENVFGSARLNRIISERLSVFGFADFSRYQPTELTFVGLKRDDFMSLQLGVDYDVSEQLRFHISAGPGRTNSDVFGFEDAFKFSNPVYDASLSYTGERNTFEASYFRTFETTGDGSLALTERFVFIWIRPETFGGTMRIPVNYVKRDPERAAELGLDVVARDYFQLAPVIEWLITPAFSLSAQIRYRDVKRTTVLSNITSRGDSTAFIIGARYYFGQRRISY